MFPGVQAMSTGHTTGNNVFVLVIGSDSQVYNQIFNASGLPVSGYFLTVPMAVNSIAIPSTD